MSGQRAPQSHVNGDGRPKRVFETESAAMIEVQRLQIQQVGTFTWYVCGQKPEHWHLARVRGGVR